MEDIVIVGGGLAAARTAEALRAEGFAGPIRIISEERHTPYERPPLSKGYLQGGEELDAVFPLGQEWYAEHEVTLDLGVAATSIDRPARRLGLSDDRSVEYGQLVLATGSAPRRSGLPGEDAPNVRVLRTIEDSTGLRDALRQGGRVAIAGTGWIGLEVAAAARGYGAEVTALGRGGIPLQSALGPELGTMYRELHEEHGVAFRTAAVQGFEVTDGVATGVLTDRGRIPADLVVLGLGAEPRTGLAEAAGLAVGDGIEVDAALRTSDPSILAVGDVASILLPSLGARTRNEHWATAGSTAAVAAKTLTGQQAAYDEIPYFYSDQYDVGMEYSGYGSLAKEARVVFRGDRAGREFVAFWVRDGRVVAGMNVNVWDVNDAVQRLIRSGRTVEEARLADSSVPIDEV